MRLLDLGCRAVLRLYPADVREARGAEMRQTFLDACAHASRHGRLAAVGAAHAELLDLLRCAASARLGRPVLSVWTPAVHLAAA